MAKQSSSITRCIVDEFDLSGFINAWEMNVPQEVPPVTCLSDTGPRRVVGNYDVTGSHSGFFDAADGGLDPTAFTDLASDENHYKSLLLGTTEGAVAYLEVLRQIEQTRGGAIGQAVVLNLSHEGSGGLARGMVLRNATLVAAGNGTGREMGATTAGRVFAVHFHLLSLLGDDITLTVEDSDDDDDADPYALVTGLTSGSLIAAGVVRATTAAVTKSWKRVVASGTFTSARVVVTAGEVAGTVGA